jgi:hypothetical protein
MGEQRSDTRARVTLYHGYKALSGFRTEDDGESDEEPTRLDDDDDDDDDNEKTQECSEGLTITRKQ